MGVGHLGRDGWGGDLKPHVLFCAYGAGHMGMLLPVAGRLLEHDAIEATFLGLTTAQAQVREAGYPVLGLADFLVPEDAVALEKGRQLSAELGVHPSVGEVESVAYLGLSYRDLADAVGPDEAAARYAALGRHVFLPVATMRRILACLRPDLLVITNSPRAERAAALAARELGIRCLCVNSLLAIDEVEWLGEPGFADRVCVLNEAVRQRLLNAGRQPHEVVVTGNPSFDLLGSSNAISAARAWRVNLLSDQGIEGDAVRIVVFAAQPEPPNHPSAPGKVGQTDLPWRVAQALQTWAHADPTRRVALVRPHPSEPLAAWSQWPAGLIVGSPLSLPQLLHAVDAVVTLTSTVGVEAHVIGKPVVQVLGSIFDHALPLADLGMAVRCNEPRELATILDGVLSIGAEERYKVARLSPIADATDRVCQQVLSLIS